PRAPPGKEELGDVVRDAADHLRVIASDSVALAKLEARRTLERVTQAARQIAPRAAILATAAVLGLVGVVLGLIAAFMARGGGIRAVAVRLGIYAAVSILLAASFGFMAGKGAREASRSGEG